MIKFDKLFNLLRERELKEKDLVNEKVGSYQIFSKMKHGKYISAHTITKLCDYLQCQPCDIMEYIC